MPRSTFRTKTVPWVILGGVAVVLVLYLYIGYPSSHSRISWTQSSIEGLESALSDKAHGRNLRVLIVHGIGEHCIGYSDRLMQGILRELGLRKFTTINRPFLEKLRDRAEEEALAFVKRYRDQGWVPDKPNSRKEAGKELVDHLFELAKGIRVGDIPLADERKVQVDRGTASGQERKREVGTATALQVFADYGLIDSGCARVPLPQSKEDKDFDLDSEHPARVNTCTAISRFADPADSIDCHRLTLDFYHRKTLEELYKKDKAISPPEVPPRRCRETSDAPKDTICTRVQSVDLGFLVTRVLRLPPPDDGIPRQVLLYELTWDPATRWAKQKYTSHDDEFDRDWLNQVLKKEVINNSISDAIMYLGSSRPLIQFPLLTALCKILTDGLEVEGVDAPSVSPDGEEFVCANSNLAAVNGEVFAETNELVILTHSLGTRILFDTLGLLARPEPRETPLGKLVKGLGMNYAYLPPEYVNKISTHLEPTRVALMGSLRKIFVLTNQIPLLEMASLGGPVFSESPTLSPRDIGIDFRRFLENRTELAKRLGHPIEPLQLVAFTDPNDLLSYSLWCWYQGYVLRIQPEMMEQLRKLRRTNSEHEKDFLEAIRTCWRPDSSNKFAGVVSDALRSLWSEAQQELKISEVSVHLQSLRVAGLFTEPSGAHSNYFHDDMIYNLIACGIKEGGRASGPCAENLAGE